MDADREAEAAVAAALAAVLADTGYWREYAAAGVATAPSAVLAQGAVDLYRRVVAFLEGSRDADPDAPAVQAIGAAREIADWGVLASYAAEQVRERIPPRSAFEWLIRVDGIDRWARELGYDLGIAETDLPDEAWSPESEETAAETTDLLAAWAAISKRYGWFLDQLEDEDGDMRRAWESPTMKDTVEHWRELIARLIDLTRPWLAWCRRHGEIELLPLVGAMLLMSEGLFVAGWEWPEDGVMLPRPAMISDVLRESGALDWLAEHGAELPEWLT